MKKFDLKNLQGNKRTLRSGRQTPVKLTFNNIRTKEQLAGRLSTQLMADSASIVALMNDSAFLSTYNLTPNTSMSASLTEYNITDTVTINKRTR